MLKKILKIGSITMLVIVAAMIIIPFAFKGKIMQLVKEEANKNLNATLQFSDLDLSLFRSFPYMSIGLDNLSIVGKGAFIGDTLIAARSIRLSTDLMSIITGSEIGIRSFEIKEAAMLLKILKDGKANWDITKPSPPPPPGVTEAPPAFKARLHHYALENCRIVYDDRQSDMLVKIENADHEGSGDFTADFTDLETETKIEAFSFTYSGVPYLVRAKLGYKAGFGLDLKNSVYEFRENALSLNDLQLKFAGSVAMPADDITMDIKYEVLKNNVSSFFSLIPGAYTDDFSNIKSAGKLAFNGFVKGTYGEKSMPGFAFNLLIENGMIQYPTLPGAISNLQVKTTITNPGGDADKTVIDVSKFHADLAGVPVDARLIVRTPVSDPDLDAALKGRIDLGKVKDYLPLEKKTSLSGLLDANVEFRGRLSAIEQQKYQQFQASGSASLNNFRYNAPSLPQEVLISNAAMSFTPKAINLSSFKMVTGKSDLSASGSVENYLAYVFANKPLSGSLNLSSRLFDLNPFMAESSTKDTATAKGSGNSYIPIPDRIAFILQASFETLLYDNMRLNNLKGVLELNEQVLKMRDVVMNTLGGNIELSGMYDTRDIAGPGLDLNLQVKDINIREAAATFSTVKALVPVAENATGTASLKLNFAAKTDKNFNLIYPTLNGSGNISTSRITIEGFEMVKRTAEALKLDKLKKWQLEKFSAGFAIRGGKLFVEPFDTRIGNYKAKIAGSNGIDQSIDYVVNIDVPRAEFGGAANTVLNKLSAQANAKGIKGNLPEIIPVTVKISGTFKDPKIQTDIRQQKNDVMEDLRKQAGDKLKEEAERKRKVLEEKANAEKEKLLNEAEKEKGRLKQEAQRKLEEEKEKARKKAAEEGKKKLNKLLKRP